MKRILPASFFDRPTLTVARELLGKYIVRRRRDGVFALMITEVEAYDGPDDRASHASRGLTPRTRIMFGPAGYLYVYFTYGMHWLINVVTGPKGYPAAVLLRAGAYKDPLTGKWISIKGPARLTKFLGISGVENGKRANRTTGVWFEDRGVKVLSENISEQKRIGIDYAGPVWKNKLYNLQISKFMV